MILAVSGNQPDPSCLRAWRPRQHSCGPRCDLLLRRQPRTTHLRPTHASDARSSNDRAREWSLAASRLAPSLLWGSPVKILVDDDEPTVQRVWEQRLRERVAKASEIFERLFRVRFEVTATALGTWTTRSTTLIALCRIRSGNHACASQLAIGFTSQYPAISSAATGSYSGPLHPYVLVREWSPQITETERLEILVHELDTSSARPTAPTTTRPCGRR